jgi:hypothetical protein
MFRTESAYFLVLIAHCVFASPLSERGEQVQFSLPKSYAALGDSYASGLGSGFFTNNSRDGVDGKSRIGSLSKEDY